MNKILVTPENFDVEADHMSCTVSYKWFKWHAWFLIFFAVIWNGFLVGWFSVDSPWFFKAFASIHVAVGIGLVWYILCLFFNKTTITISKQELTVHHAPIPFFGYKNASLTRMDIQQIYIIKEIKTNKNSTTISFSLRVLTPKNKSIKLSIDCEDYESAIFIKRKVEEYMRIDPSPVEGEYLGN